MVLDLSKKRSRLRIIIPAYPAFNIYSHIAHKTTALGPLCVASAAKEMDRWDVEVIDENNLRRYGPRSDSIGADHEFLQKQKENKNGTAQNTNLCRDLYLVGRFERLGRGF